MDLLWTQKCFTLTCNYPFANLENCWYGSKFDISSNEKIDPKTTKSLFDCSYCKRA